MTRYRRISKRKRPREPAGSDFLRREYASESSGISRRQEQPSIPDNRPKLLDRHWTVQELSPKLLDELEVAWERHYGALPPIRRLKRNTTIKPLQINLEEYDEETTAEL